MPSTRTTLTALAVALAALSLTACSGPVTTAGDVIEHQVHEANLARSAKALASSIDAYAFTMQLAPSALQPGQYAALVEELGQAGVTVSVGNGVLTLTSGAGSGHELTATITLSDELGGASTVS